MYKSIAYFSFKQGSIFFTCDVACEKEKKNLVKKTLKKLMVSSFIF